VSKTSVLVETVARALADAPDQVRVVERQHQGTTLVELFMAPGDLGHVIGRQGRTATAIRTLAALAAEREGQRVQVEFRDEQR
jgi:predicted RNA-binding protein YlqC (UPF0109 family)